MSKKNIRQKPVNSQLFEDTWDSAYKQLLFPKYKYSYTEQELIRLKRLIIFSLTSPYFRFIMTYVIYAAVA